jgi:hypothetical protein
MVPNYVKIYNILNDKYWYDRVISSIPGILQSGHHNALNYENLEERLKLYDCFNVVVDSRDDSLLAISGLFNGSIFPKNVARVLDRTYYYNWASDLASSFNPVVQYNTFLMMPYQIEVAKEKGYDAVFFSMQTLKTRPAMAKMVRRQHPYKFELLDKMYNTCKCSPDTEICWQNIGIHYFNKITLDLPSITTDEYNAKYKRS